MEEYWYFLLPAIIIALTPTKEIDKVTKKWIPDDRKRAKFFMGFLIVMMLFSTVFLFLVSESIPLGFRLPMCLFPLAALGLGFWIARLRSRRK